MRLFKSVIERHAEIENPDGNRFPKTFGKLMQVEELLDAVNEIELIASNLFIHPKHEGQEYRFGSLSVALVMESYEEMHGELTILKLAKSIDAMAAELAA